MSLSSLGYAPAPGRVRLDRESISFLSVQLPPGGVPIRSRRSFRNDLAVGGKTVQLFSQVLRGLGGALRVPSAKSQC